MVLGDPNEERGLVVVATGSGAAQPQMLRADAHGTLRFDAPVGEDTTVRVRQQG